MSVSPDAQEQIPHARERLDTRQILTLEQVATVLFDALAEPFEDIGGHEHRQ